MADQLPDGVFRMRPDTEQALRYAFHAAHPLETLPESKEVEPRPSVWVQELDLRSAPVLQQAFVHGFLAGVNWARR